MTDQDKPSENMPATEPKDIPPLWTVFAYLGSAICAGVGAWQAFHMRTAFIWGFASMACLLIGQLARRKIAINTANEMGANGANSGFAVDLSTGNTPDVFHFEPPTSAGIWPIIWFALAAVCGIFAILAMIDRNVHPMYLNGGLALAAGYFASVLKRRQRATRGHYVDLFAQLPVNAVVSYGFAGFFFLYGLLLVLLLSGQYGTAAARWDNLILYSRGVEQMAFLFAFIFAALGQLAMRGRIVDSTYWAITAVACAVCFLLGPTLTVQISRMGETQWPEIYLKYSLPDMLNAKEEVFLRVETVSTSFGENRIVCIGQRKHVVLMFGHRTPWIAMLDALHTWTPEEIQQRANQCEIEVKEAIGSGAAIESTLSTDQVSQFSDRVQADPETYKGREMVIDAQQLPEPLKSKLTKLLPEGSTSISAFDIALAIGDLDTLAAIAPSPIYIEPHQRKALFDLGLIWPLDSPAFHSNSATTVPKNDGDHVSNGSRTTMEIPNDLKRAVRALLDTRGSDRGYSDLDYYYANRYCDVAYAEFLRSRGIVPTTLHLLHLLSTIGQVQYPNVRDAYWSGTTPLGFATPMLGLPDEKQLPKCLALASFYAKAVRDLNGEHPELFDERRQPTAYDVIYEIVEDAVFEWRRRHDDRDPKDSGVSNRTVVGDPLLLINAANEVLKLQPASYEQYCAWASTAHTWLSPGKGDRLDMIAPMLELSKQWRQSKLIYQSPSASCSLSGLYAWTSEYHTREGALKYLNTALEEVGIPCHASLATLDNPNELYCNGKMESWTQSVSRVAEADDMRSAY
jgi:hypothetical protein